MFKIDHRSIADVEPFEHIPGADGLALGSAAKLASGALAKAGATDTPTHIIMGVKDERGEYPAVRVLKSTIFDTTSSATVASTLVGSSVTLHTDALGVTATTTSGVFTITETDGANSVKGYFNV